MMLRALGLLAIVLGSSPSVHAEDYTIEKLEQEAPKELDAALRAAMAKTGYRILKDGKAFAELWWLAAAPAASKPSGPNGTILFPVLEEGQLLGALRYVAEGQDYRDQAIPEGVYTLRYGLQPINGAHLGVSPFRDYALLLPASKDNSLDKLAKKGLEERSAEAAGTSHPAVLMLLNPPEGEPKSPSMAFDDTKQTWGAVVALPLNVKGGETASLNVQLVVSGAAAP
jgi:hypothetical protein